MDVDRVRLLFDQQVRAWVPKWPPVGAVIEQDGLVTRIHYGTHATVTHPDLPSDGLDEVISQQVQAFTDRGEPAEWKVYTHACPRNLGDRLAAAGFTAGWTRQVLVADANMVLIEDQDEQLLDLVEATGPHHTPLGELLASGRRSQNVHTAALTRDGQVLAAGWVERLDGTDFAVAGGMTAPQPAILSNLCAWVRSKTVASPATHILAEAAGGLADLLTSTGFVPIASVTSYHLASSAPPAHERPVVDLPDAEYRRIWDRFYADFQFKPGMNSMPAIAEPATSVTWNLGAIDDDQSVDELQRIVERGLRACTEPGEQLYWLDWQHPSYRFDPTRVGTPGRPRWPGGAYPDGDYFLYLTPDLRLGTFGHPWEHSLCVFGADLLAEIEADLTRLLGTVIRRGAGR